MDIDNYYSSGYLKANDLEQEAAVVTITEVYEATLSDNTPVPALRMQELDKPILIKNAHAKNLRAMFGKNTEAWVGQMAEIYKTTVSYQGTDYEVLRFRAPKLKTAINSQTAQPGVAKTVVMVNRPGSAAVSADPDDDIPF